MNKITRVTIRPCFEVYVERADPNRPKAAPILDIVSSYGSRSKADAAAGEIAECEGCEVEEATWD